MGQEHLLMDDVPTTHISVSMLAVALLHSQLVQVHIRIQWCMLRFFGGYKSPNSIEVSGASHVVSSETRYRRLTTLRSSAA